ncbi:hypothetical protein ACNUDN_11810 [Mycobacterium sp. smrl_JER01]|uniref:hypothetical protein n=1 Tax=Mycobacterium sp. smrl_JER01 TaxID=3402633 RepID=UPI003ACD4A42
MTAAATTFRPPATTPEARRKRRLELKLSPAASPSFRAFAKTVNIAELDEALVAVHEAGHAVAGEVLGGRGTVHSAVTTPSFSMTGVQGKTFYTDALDAQIKGSVAFAGSYAEARWAAGPRPSTRAVAAARARHGCSDDAVVAALVASGDYHHRACDRVLEGCWPAVMTLAGKLFTDGEVTGTDVLAALGCDEQDHAGTAFRLANLRSGLLTL